MIEQFANELKEKLIQYDKARPFICEGNPLECEVFIVGINAATEMENDFWSFWSNESGFDKKKWLASYILERFSKPLKPNRTRRNNVSNTRQRIEWIVNSINPIKTLETNLFVKPTATAQELKKADRDSSIFEFLLQSIKPKVIFAHGKEVKDYLEKLYNIELVNEEINNIEMVGMNMQIISMQHLSRGWSKDKSIEKGEWIRKIVEDTHSHRI